MEHNNKSNNKSDNQESQSYQPGQDSNNVDHQDHLTDEQRAANGQVNDEYEERKDEAQDVQSNETKYKKLKALLAAQNDMKPVKADIESALKDTTKYDIIVDESKQRLNMIFLGHVDAGKSTICGSILRLTGQFGKDMIKELEQESRNFNRPLWLTYLLHIANNNTTLKTTSYPKFETTKKRLTILDSPGFKNYHRIINNSKAEIACLVVSARLGEFEAGFEKGGQTTEYALLTKNLGVQDLIVLVNKMDDNQIGWSQERYEHIKTKLTPFLRDSCGYDLEKNVYWLPISAQNSDNMMADIKDPRGSWYAGPTFFQLLDDLPVPERDPEGPVRIPVLDKFQDGSNLNVIGRVESGTITYGMQLTVVPNGEALTIDTIYNYDDQRIPYAKAGENVRLIIKNVEDQSISKGDVICSKHSFIYACTEIECEINILSLPQHKPIISPGYTCVLHIHAAITEVTITAIKAEVDKAATKLKPVRFLKSGSVGIVRLARTDNNAICCEKFEKNSYLGGVVLRDEGMTIAFGKVLRVKPI